MLFLTSRGSRFCVSHFRFASLAKLVEGSRGKCAARAQWLDHRRTATVDIDGGAGDVGALLGGEEAGEVGELFRRTDAAERYALGQALGEGVEIHVRRLRSVALHPLIGNYAHGGSW